MMREQGLKTGDYIRIEFTDGAKLLGTIIHVPRGVGDMLQIKNDKGTLRYVNLMSVNFEQIVLLESNQKVKTRFIKELTDDYLIEVIRPDDNCIKILIPKENASEYLNQRLLSILPERPIPLNLLTIDHYY